jgi:WD40 repeat protein
MAPWIAETCIFSPDGEYLVAGGTIRGRRLRREVRIWPWKTATSTSTSTRYHQHCCRIHQEQDRNQLVWCRIQPTQNLFTVCNFQTTAKQLVTGGSDAIVGLWDCGSTRLCIYGHAAAASMVCTTTSTRRLKFIRSTAFSHDSQLLAIATEEDGIDVADATSGASVGL